MRRLSVLSTTFIPRSKYLRTGCASRLGGVRLDVARQADLERDAAVVHVVHQRPRPRSAASRGRAGARRRGARPRAPSPRRRPRRRGRCTARSCARTRTRPRARTPGYRALRPRGRSRRRPRSLIRHRQLASSMETLGLAWLRMPQTITAPRCRAPARRAPARAAAPPRLRRARGSPCVEHGRVAHLDVAYALPARRPGELVRDALERLRASASPRA